MSVIEFRQKKEESPKEEKEMPITGGDLIAQGSVFILLIGLPIFLDQKLGQALIACLHSTALAAFFWLLMISAVETPLLFYTIHEQHQKKISPVDPAPSTLFIGCTSIFVFVVYFVVFRIYAPDAGFTTAKCILISSIFMIWPGMMAVLLSVFLAGTYFEKDLSR